MTPKEILQRLEKQEVLIVGDVMIDRYLTGAVTRISPEAPVPVVLYHATEDRLGGAANVALNVHALGGVPLLCSVVGSDVNGEVFRHLLPDAGITAEGIVHSDERTTTVKTRVLGNNQQILRIDQEDTHPLSERETRAFLDKVFSLLDSRPVRVIVFQDYNKGVLTEEVIRSVIEEARKRGIPTAVDPKKEHFFAYQGVDLFKPNLKEIRDSAPFPVAPELKSLREASEFIRKTLQNRITMITLSEKGLFLDADQHFTRLYPTVPRNVADVSGAGDTVISVAALGLAAGLELDLVAALSNLAGGQVCEFTGVVPVRRDILATELEHWLIQHPLL
ncbi:MAG: carbohydrate kinase [Saprospiraceae bacterium]|nr:carbohydrate kinase [Saprospiraceae bacterium]